MKYCLLLILTLSLSNCNNSERNSQTQEVTLSKNDSLKIYEDILNNTELKRAEKILDSIKRSDNKLYRNIKVLTDEFEGLEKYSDEYEAAEVLLKDDYENKEPATINGRSY